MISKFKGFSKLGKTWWIWMNGSLCPISNKSTQCAMECWKMFMPSDFFFFGKIVFFIQKMCAWCHFWWPKMWSKMSYFDRPHFHKFFSLSCIFSFPFFAFWRLAFWHIFSELQKFFMTDHYRAYHIKGNCWKMILQVQVSEPLIFFWQDCDSDNWLLIIEWYRISYIPIQIRFVHY